MAGWSVTNPASPTLWALGKEANSSGLAHRARRHWKPRYPVYTEPPNRKSMMAAEEQQARAGGHESDGRPTQSGCHRPSEQCVPSRPARTWVHQGESAALEEGRHGLRSLGV